MNLIRNNCELCCVSFLKGPVKLICNDAFVIHRNIVIINKKLHSRSAFIRGAGFIRCSNHKKHISLEVVIGCNIVVEHHSAAIRDHHHWGLIFERRHHGHVSAIGVPCGGPPRCIDKGPTQQKFSEHAINCFAAARCAAILTVSCAHVVRSDTYKSTARKLNCPRFGISRMAGITVKQHDSGGGGFVFSTARNIHESTVGQSVIPNKADTRYLYITPASNYSPVDH